MSSRCTAPPAPAAHRATPTHHITAVAGGLVNLLGRESCGGGSVRGYCEGGGKALQHTDHAQACGRMRGLDAACGADSWLACTVVCIGAVNHSSATCPADEVAVATFADQLQQTGSTRRGRELSVRYLAGSCNNLNRARSRVCNWCGCVRGWTAGDARSNGGIVAPAPSRGDNLGQAAAAEPLASVFYPVTPHTPHSRRRRPSEQPVGKEGA